MENVASPFYSISSNKNLLLSELDIMLGIIRCDAYCLALNHLNILSKYANDLNTTMF